LPDPVTGDQFVGLGKRAIDDGPVLAREANSHPFRAGLQAFARQHDSGLDQLFVEFAHCAQKLDRRHHSRLRLLRCFDEYHDFHL
jgi:hypothetical protein